jgi:small GTP-binding protein
MENNCKIVFLGESRVGKTSLISRFMTGAYEDGIESTSIALFSSKTIEIQGQLLRFDMWDTAGQEKYRSLTKFFYKDIDIAILVYDITNRKSFEEIRDYWYNQVRTMGMNNPIIGFVGNKCDKVDEAEISENEARDFTACSDAEFGLASAVENIGIDDLLLRLGTKYLNVMKKYENPSGN